MADSQVTVFQSILDYLCSSAFLISLAVVIIAIVVLVIGKKIAKRLMDSASPEDGDRVKVVKSIYAIVKYVLIFLLVVIVLQLNGVNVSAAMTGLGVAGIVVGLALNSAISNIIMGMRIIFDKFFRTGDVIEYEGKLYEIVSLSFQTTKMRSLETNGIRSVSNHLLSQIEVVGDMFSADVLLSRDVEPAKSAAFVQSCVAAIKQIEGVSDASYAGLQNVDAGGNLHRFAFWCNPVDSPAIKRAVNGVIDCELRHANLEIPLNALEVRAVE